MLLKLLQKDQFKKTAEATDGWIVTKLPIQLQKFKKIHNKIIQKQLQMSMIPKERCISPEKRQDIIDELRLK